MVRTTIFIEDADKKALKLEAQRLGKSEAELIRAGIKHVLNESGKEVKLPSFIGIARSTATTPIAQDMPNLRKQWAQDVIAKKFDGK